MSVMMRKSRVSREPLTNTPGPGLARAHRATSESLAGRGQHVGTPLVSAWNAQGMKRGD